MRKNVCFFSLCVPVEVVTLYPIPPDDKCMRTEARSVYHNFF